MMNGRTVVPESESFNDLDGSYIFGNHKCEYLVHISVRERIVGHGFGCLRGDAQAALFRDNRIHNLKSPRIFMRPELTKTIERIRNLIGDRERKDWLRRSIGLNEKLQSFPCTVWILHLLRNEHVLCTYWIHEEARYSSEESLRVFILADSFVYRASSRAQYEHGGSASHDPAHRFLLIPSSSDFAVLEPSSLIRRSRQGFTDPFPSAGRLV